MKRPSALVVLAAYLLAAAGLAHVLVRTHGPDLPLHFLAVPVLLASLYYPRWVYLTMSVSGGLIACMVITVLFPKPLTSLRTLATLSVVTVVVCELLHLLTAIRMRAEASLRDSTERLQALVGASPAAIFAVDAAGSVQSWNPAAERIFGWREYEVLGRPLPVVPEDEREGWFRRWRARLQEGHTLANLEVRCRTRGALPDQRSTTH